MSNTASLKFEFKRLIWQLAGILPPVSKRRLWLPEKLSANSSKPDKCLTISTIIRNEEPYLREWIEFHHMMGVEHFYIYDNGSTDRSVDILKKYQEAGLITVIPWANYLSGWEGVSGPLGRMQRLSMLHSIANFGSGSHWMAFIDTDEFLFPVADKNLHEVLSRYEDLDSLSVYWNIFGTSGHTRKPDGLVTENYTQRLRRPDGKNKTLSRVKSIVRPAAVRGVHNTHTLMLKDGYPCSWNENRQKIGFADHRLETFSNDIIRINHYYSKSLSEYRARQNVPAEGPRLDFRGDDQLLTHIEDDAITDVTIQRFLPELRRRMAATSAGNNATEDSTESQQTIS